MSSRLDAKLRDADPSLDDDYFYEALLKYKAVVARTMKKRDFVAAENIAVNGTNILLSKGKIAAATPLMLMLFDVYKESGDRTFDEPTKATLLELNDHIVAVECDDQSAKQRNQLQFLRECLTFSRKTGAYKFGDPDINHAIAKCIVAGGDVGASSPYYLHAHCPDEYAKTWFKFATRKGYRNEVDVFLTRSVLQLLAVHNLKDANTFYDTFMGLRTGPNTPLSNFNKFLLETVRRDAYPLFQMLRQKYATVLQYDSKFNRYMDRIGEHYFGVKPTKTGMAAMMESMFGGMMGK